MKIDVDNYEEQKDGSAILTINLDQEAIQYLVNYAVNDLVKKACDEVLGGNYEVQSD